MDDYLDCLFQYVLEMRLCERIRSSLEYQQASNESMRKMEILKSTLTHEQKTALNEFLSANGHLLNMDEYIIFQEAIALGKWMAR